MAKGSSFQSKPIPWMYSTLGSMAAIALMKLLPIHRKLTELEIKNIQDYFNSSFISPERRQQLSRLSAFFMTYASAIGRMPKISREARQDYYALNRRGRFAVDSIPRLESPQYPDSPYLPLLIIPGLNTPAVFFREMHSYFQQQGYNVTVLSLPQDGLADVFASAEVVKAELDRLKRQCQHEQVNVIGHCLGGVIAQYCVERMEEPDQKPSVQNLIALGTGFMGAEGVSHLKDLWIPRNPGKPIPQVFDELIQWDWNIAHKSQEVAYHSVLTIWDMMVHYRKGMLENPHGGTAVNHIIDDPAIDHLTLALNHSVFARIEKIIQTVPAPPRYVEAFAGN